MKISIPSKEGSVNGALDAPIGTLIVAGWTGRNLAAVEHHIEELKAIGVPPPSTTPLFYRASPQLTSTEHEQFFFRRHRIWRGGTCHRI